MSAVTWKIGNHFNEKVYDEHKWWHEKQYLLAPTLKVISARFSKGHSPSGVVRSLGSLFSVVVCSPSSTTGVILYVLLVILLWFNCLFSHTTPMESRISLSFLHVELIHQGNLGIGGIAEPHWEVFESYSGWRHLRAYSRGPTVAATMPLIRVRLELLHMPLLYNSMLSQWVRLQNCGVVCSRMSSASRGACRNIMGIKLDPSEIWAMF